MASSKYPQDTIRSEIHLFGRYETIEYLYNIINNVEKPFDAVEDENGIVLIYTSTIKTHRVFDMLYEILSCQHSKLIDKDDGLYIDDGKLIYKDCEVWIKTH